MARHRPLKVVVDTNVVAYYLLATEPFVEEVRAFWHRPLDPAAPTLWEAEVSNVLWMAARTGVIDKRVALRRLGLAARLGIRSVPTRRLWRGALARALNSNVAAYDTLFVELAVRDVVHGREIRNREALANPDALDQFRNRPELNS